MQSSEKKHLSYPLMTEDNIPIQLLKPKKSHWRLVFEKSATEARG